MARPRILITRTWPEGVIRHLEQRYELTSDPADRPLSKAELIEAMGIFDALCPTVSDRLDAEVITAPGARVRLIANYGAGVDHIDLASAARQGIVVTNTPDVLTRATAELAILLMLMLSRRAGEGERELRAGQWAGWRPTHMMGRDLSGKLLGLVGFGRIAQQMARMAQAAFGMRICYHSRRPVDPALFPEAGFVASLDDLLAHADVVSLHCPGGDETRHLIDARRLSLMQRSAVLINTARGSVVDERALADALSSGGIGGAGLDVYEREPQIEPALLACGNLVLLPHLGSATIETRTDMGLRVAANLDAFFGRTCPPDAVTG